MNASFTPVSAVAEIRNLEEEVRILAEINSAECIRAIDSLLLNGFTEKDISLSEAFLTFWKPTEPQMFGEDLHPNLEFVGFELMPIEMIESYQEHRAGSENKKLKNIKSSIASNGYKLKYIPPAVIIGAKGVVDHIITGNTRIKILKDFIHHLFSLRSIVTLLCLFCGLFHFCGVWKLFGNSGVKRIGCGLKYITIKATQTAKEAF